MKRKRGLSIQSASVLFKISRDTVRRALLSADLKPGKDGRYSERDVKAALSTPIRVARARLLLAKAKRAEHELRDLEQNYMPADDTRRYILLAFSNCQNLADEIMLLAPQLNPSDPQHARQHLARWLAEFHKMRPSVPEKPKRSKEEKSKGKVPDTMAARSRLTLAKAKIEEIKLRIDKGELIDFETSAMCMSNTFPPLRQLIVAASGNLAALVNPSDPHAARVIIDKWRDDWIERAREEGAPTSEQMNDKNLKTPEY